LFERIRSERTDQLSVELEALRPEERGALLAALPALERLADQLKRRGSR
jgi:hypothetical protein